MIDKTIPSFSTRFWSDEVGLADPDAMTPRAGGTYEFSSRRVFTDNSLYDPRPVEGDGDLTLLDVVVVSRQVSSANTVASSGVSVDMAASTGQGQRTEVYMGDTGTMFATTTQVQAAQASAAVGIDASVQMAQSQGSVVHGGDAGTAFVGSSQRQGSTAQVGVALNATMATSAAQHNAGLTTVAVAVAHSSRQAQHAAALAEQGSLFVTTAQAQAAAASAAVGVSAQVSSAQGQDAAAAAGMAISAAATTRQGQSSSAHAGGDGYAFVASAQAQRSSAAAGATNDAGVVTRQSQRATAVLLKSAVATVATRQGQRAALLCAAATGSAAATAQRQSAAAVASVANSAVAATTLYVSPAGSDSNTGTASAPLRTIQRAVTRALAGDIVSVAPGTYAESIYGTNDGTANSPIRFVSAVKWGAVIVPPVANSTRSFGFEHRGDYVTIDGFEVDGTVDPTSGVVWNIGIGVSGTGSVIQRCHAHHIFRNSAPTGNGGAGVLIDAYYGGSNMKALGNLCHHIGPQLRTTTYHGIYCTSTGEVKNNVCYANSSGGIHCWHDVHDCVVANNTVFSNLNTGIIFGGGDFVNTTGPCDFMTVVNNICYDNPRGILEFGAVGSHNVIAYNLCNSSATANYETVATTHTNDISGNPLFVSYQADGSGDYHLQAGSPARNAGLATYAPVTDYDSVTRGTPPDLGSFDKGGGVILTPTLFVATTGSDANNGLTSGAPFLTITHAASVAVPGSVISVASGSYSGDFVTAASGTSSQPIVYVSATRWGAAITSSNSASGSMVWRNTGSYVVIDGFDISGASCVGLMMSGSHCEARHNHVHHITANPSGTTTPSNTGDGFGGAAIGFDQYNVKTGGIADSNLVHDIGPAGFSFHRVQGIYASIPEVVITNNIIYKVTGYGVTQGHASWNVIVANNTIFACGGYHEGGGIVITNNVNSSHPSNNNVVCNNVIYNCVIGVHEERVVAGVDTTLYTNNLVFNESGLVAPDGTAYQMYGNMVNSHTGISANPLFVNYQADGSGDYHLQSGSAAVGSGIATYAPATDYDGHARPVGAAFDLGAFEYGSA